MRVLYGWLLFLAAVAIIAVGGLVFPIALGTVAYIAGNEYIAMVRAKGIHPSVRIIRGMIIACFVVAALPAVPGLNLSWNFSLEHTPILLTVGMCSAFFRLLLRHEDPPATIADIAATVLGFIYVGWLPSHLVLLRNLCPPGSEKIDNPLQQHLGDRHICLVLWQKVRQAFTLPTSKSEKDGRRSDRRLLGFHFLGNRGRLRLRSVSISDSAVP